MERGRAPSEMDFTERRRARESGFDGWNMTFMGQYQKLMPLLKARVLKPMDFAVMGYLQSHMEVKTGRIERRTKDVIEETGLSETYVAMSLKRLRQQKLLAKGLRGTGYYWMLDPTIWHVGGPRLFEQRVEQFAKLLDE